MLLKHHNMQEEDLCEMVSITTFQKQLPLRFQDNTIHNFVTYATNMTNLYMISDGEPVCLHIPIRILY